MYSVVGCLPASFIDQPFEKFKRTVLGVVVVKPKLSFIEIRCLNV